jgi:hypothetical protein
MTAWRDAAARRGAQSPSPYPASTDSNSFRVDHIGCLSSPNSYRLSVAAMWLHVSRWPYPDQAANTNFYSAPHPIADAAILAG